MSNLKQASSGRFRRTKSVITSSSQSSFAASTSDIPSLSRLTSSSSNASSHSSRTSSPLPSPSSSDGTFARQYDDVERLGEGAFGSVYSCRSRTDDRRYAIKRIPFFFRSHEAFANDLNQLRTQVLREGKILAALDHPNIARYYQCWVERVGIVRKHPDSVEVATSNSPTLTTRKTMHKEGDTTTWEETATPLGIEEKATPSSKVEEEDTTTREETATPLGTEEKATPSSKVEKQEPDQEHLEQEQEEGEEWDRTDNNEDVLFNQSAQSWWNDLDTGLHANPMDQVTAPFPSSSSSSSSSSASSSSSSSSTSTDGKILLLQIDLFIVMKLYDRSLQKMLEYRRPTEINYKNNLQIMHQLLQASHYIHSKGVVHRDISPCNVFFDGSSRAVLGDFGLASADTSKHRRVAAGLRGSSLLRSASFALSPSTKVVPLLRGLSTTSTVSTAVPFKQELRTKTNTFKHGTTAPTTAWDPQSAATMPPSILPRPPKQSPGQQPPPRPLVRSSTSAVLQQTLINTDSGGSIESDHVGKPLYAAPEQWDLSKEQTPTTAKADIFSLGIVCVELFSHFNTGRERIEVLMNARSGTLTKTFVKRYPAIARLALKMLVPSPNKRVSAGELLQSSLFQKEIRFLGGGTNGGGNGGGSRSEGSLLKRIDVLETFIVANGLKIPT
jgi:serine/threonine protein kinase